MSELAKDASLTVALLGNPNTGKSTLFNAVVGVRQHVGNYPGVTVEKKLGTVEIDNRDFTIIDLPGTYSLAPRSLDEMVTVDVLLGRNEEVTPPRAVICIVDASNLERNLYLVSQVFELGLPTIVALNMMDAAADKGITIDVERLEQRLGVPVVPMQANRGVGLDRLRQTLVDVLAKDSFPEHESPFPEAFQQEVALLQEYLGEHDEQAWPRYLVERLLLDTGGYLGFTVSNLASDQLIGQIETARKRLVDAGCQIPGVEAIARYTWVGNTLEGVVTRETNRKQSVSDRLDQVLTHRVWGTIVFVVLMMTVFQAIFTWAAPVMDVIDGLVGTVAETVAAAVPPGMVRSLLVNGVVAGVGGVLVFLPQIFILFLFIGILEDCGYMARAAYLMDRLMSKVGLNGKSFIPLLSSFACAIPGIMAARVIENRRDRLVTVLVAPLMTCSARLPIYALLIGAFIPAEPAWLPGATMFGLYLLGVVAAVVVAFVLKRTLLRGEVPPFVMELPSYKIPSVRTVLFRMCDRGWAFVRRAGTMILAVTVLVWAIAYFPHSPEVEAKIRGQHQVETDQLKAKIALLGSAASQAESVAELKEQIATADASLENRIAGVYIRQSVLGRMGHAIEPAVEPLGWDWQIGCAVIASLPAREVVIGTMGVLYNLGDEQDETSEPLRDKLKKATWHSGPRRGEKVFSMPVALSIMVFFALCAQCIATLAVLRRETNSWRWPAFSFAYMTILAYLGAFATYQISSRLME